VAAPIAAAAIALVAFVKVLSIASETQTKLNKALIDGAGFAGDFSMSAAQYRDTIDDLRNAVQDSTRVMLKFGGTSELAAKTINAFARESTGSLAQTRAELYRLGTGDIQQGVVELTKASMAYGSALGIGTEEAGAMMGKFTSELGYSTQGSIDTLGNIVKAAAGANMPMTKFMNIFNQVIPDVELYQNRLEELTGTIRLLSKSMSPKDVKNFMEAFAQGFKGVDFRQRLKTVLVAGTGTVSKSLEADFKAKALALSKNFAEYAAPGEDMGQRMMDVMKGGETAMSAFITEMRGRASAVGKDLSAAAVSDALKLASYEQTRRKGGALNLATAMRGGGLLSTYKILSKYGQTLTKGFNGLSEHVMKQLGITEQQYDALRTTSLTLKQQRDELKRWGKTNSKTMNTALHETVRMRKKGMTEAEIEEAMRNATDEELFTAAEMANTMKADKEQAFNLAEEQYNITSSIGDKLDNVISFLLEQILRVLNPLLDVVNNLFTWVVGGDKEKIKKTDDLTVQMQSWAKGQGEFQKGYKATIQVVSDEIKKGLAAGKKGKDLAEAVGGSGVFDEALVNLDPKTIADLVRQLGGNESTLAEIYKAQRDKDTTGMLKSLDALSPTLGPDAMHEIIMLLTQKMAIGGTVLEAAKSRMARGDTTRPGAEKWQTAQQVRTARIQAASARDLIDMTEKGLVAGRDYEAARVLAPSAPAREEIVAKAVAAGAPTPSAPVGASTVSPSAVATAKLVANKLDSGTSKEIKKQSELTEETIQAQQEGAKQAGDATVKQLKVQQDDYAATTDLFSLMKKGIRYEQSFLNTKYRNVIKEATLDSFRTALLEFAVIEEKIKDDADLRKAITGGLGWNFAAGGKAAIDAVLSATTGQEAKPGERALAKLGGGVGGFEGFKSYDNGGSVDYDRLARVHKGGYVVPAHGTLVTTGGGGVGGKTMNVQGGINVYVQTDADPHQIAESIHNLYRQH
jgi:hypothetical protein